MQQMELLVLVGWQKTGTGGKFQNNSKMVVAGIFKLKGIVMTMSI